MLWVTWISSAGIPDSGTQSPTKSLSFRSGDTSSTKVVSGRSLGAQKTVTSIVFYGENHWTNPLPHNANKLVPCPTEGKKNHTIILTFPSCTVLLGNAFSRNGDYNERRMWSLTEQKSKVTAFLSRTKQQQVLLGLGAEAAYRLVNLFSRHAAIQNLQSCWRFFFWLLNESTR